MIIKMKIRRFLISMGLVAGWWLLFWLIKWPFLFATLFIGMTIMVWLGLESLFDD